MTEAEKQMYVLEGEPITITLFGKPIEVKKFSIKGQKRAIKILSSGGESDLSTDDATDSMLDKMTAIVSLSTGVPESEIDSKSNLAEIMAAFEAIYEQNEFRFLFESMARIAKVTTGK